MNMEREDPKGYEFFGIWEYKLMELWEQVSGRNTER